MKDFIEHLEAGAEARMERMTEGLVEGMYRCGCGNIALLVNAHPGSDSPYADPICDDCLNRLIEDK